MNQETISGTLSWYKILPLTGVSLIRVKQNFSGDGKEFTKVPRAVAKNKLFSENALEFGKSCEDLSWNHRTSTPHRSETNGIAERAVRRVKEGMSAVLLQSKLDERCWSDSMECYCYLRNVQDFLADGKTPNERRFGEPFKGTMILFWSNWMNILISPRDQARIHQFRKKVLPGIFLGYELVAGGIWKGDILTADLEDWKI